MHRKPSNRNKQAGGHSYVDEKIARERQNGAGAQHRSAAANSFPILA